MKLIFRIAQAQLMTEYKALLSPVTLESKHLLPIPAPESVSLQQSPNSPR